MTTRVDPRLAERRRAVAESNARRRLRRVAWMLLVGAFAVAVVWIAQSPWFSVAHIAVSGVEESDTARILADAGVTVGTPLILLDTGFVKEEIESDPWVIEATVRRVFPDAVEVAVTERTPFAWVQTSSRWAVVARDTTVLRYDPEPGGPRVLFAGDRRLSGDAWVSGAVEFLAGLPDAVRRQAVLDERDGEMWAVVADSVVRLGLPTEMSQKAAALVALLQEEPGPGSIINLVAPTRPAIVDA